MIPLEDGLQRETVVACRSNIAAKPIQNQLERPRLPIDRTLLGFPMFCRSSLSRCMPAASESTTHDLAVPSLHPRQPPDPRTAGIQSLCVSAVPCEKHAENDLSTPVTS